MAQRKVSIGEEKLIPEFDSELHGNLRHLKNFAACFRLLFAGDSLLPKELSYQAKSVDFFL